MLKKPQQWTDFLNWAELRKDKPLAMPKLLEDYVDEIQISISSQGTTLLLNITLSA